MWEFCAGLENQPKPGLDMKLVTEKKESSVKHNRGLGFKGNDMGLYFFWNMHFSTDYTANL